MKTANKTVKSLNYLSQFSCIGGICEDNCCIGWDVDIDLATYQKYQKVSDPELKALYKSKIKPYPYFFSEDVDYARVKLGKNKRCPFLNDEGLCKTQAKLGEALLSNVCATYPRMTNAIDGVLENTLTLSCPVAAKLVLLQPEGLYWVDNPAPPQRIIVNLSIQTDAPEYKKHPVRYFHSLRALSITLLTDRKYPVWQRLYHLGLAFEAFSEAVEGKRVSELPKLIQSFEEKHLSGNWGPLPGLSPLEAAATQLHRVDDLIERLKVFTEIDSHRFVAHTKTYQKSFQQASKNKKSKPGAYLSLHERYSNDFEKNHGYILENYLVNFVYKNLFPFTESENLFEAYTMLALRFVMIRTYLVALSANPLSPEQAASFIQVFAKTVEHHKRFSEDTLSVLRSEQLNNLRYMEALIFEEIQP